MKYFVIVIIGAVFSLKTAAQEKIEPVLYGNMDHWVVRNIKESGIIGGNAKTLYEIGPSRTIDGNIPYKNMGKSPWATSNVMAKVMGVVKTNQSVYRDTHGNGYCAKLMTHVEHVKVLGLMNISVLAAGSIFLGDIQEPITGTKDGEKSLNWGIPYNKRPKALRYDYRVSLSGSPNRIKQTGFSKVSTVSGKDCAVTVLLLQKRTEDAKGNIMAKRVGTMVIEYAHSTKEWVENATYRIMYGDIHNHPGYDARLMGLRSTDYARNSKGKSVQVKETGWASEDDTPTHLVLQFSSSNGGAFIGSPGNTFWIDNVRLVF
ncbi:PCMD domain-containing protein [Hoylesella oralis]|uniref:PCMD domain-containing protein n=1 Tax=Hoylesella oralis TaxID=28134 RepID=UPI0028E5BC3F|nr:PCMD domain-containing protein [Hoylesella oralis]